MSSEAGDYGGEIFSGRRSLTRLVLSYRGRATAKVAMECGTVVDGSREQSVRRNRR